MNKLTILEKLSENTQSHRNDNNAWGSTHDNMEINYTLAISLWFDEECYKLEEQRKQAKLKYFQVSNKVKGDKSQPTSQH